ncbi:helix-turn-helix domain-containing protein [Granulibacter bethesdensis]|uniref:helix-turn-helix domain-containing protein n=1 Tax=Granulibacter bethesdensis TaxID=364410 RepID=UPI0003F1DAFD|nr:XRE family transcriptional regulator [Granulibacter bethesdensis]AHJ69357.1 Hypothetical protein GbCGDNIH2_7305 [Granulibacter bethesdensis]
MADKFNPEMLILARTAQGMSQSDLALACRIVSQGTISKIESGLLTPTPETVHAFCDILGFTERFFSKPAIRTAFPVSYNRKKQKLSKSSYEEIISKSRIIRLSIEDMLNSVEITPQRRPLPSIDIDDYNGDVESVALAIRQMWQIPRGPIQDVTSIIESAGIIVFRMDFGTNLIDGFSQHSVDGFPPIIFVNENVPPDRLRFTLCHELAHLTLHILPNPNMEIEADQFSSAFLMPRDDIIHDLNRCSLETFMRLKLSWKVAMSALIRRARDLGKISESNYKYYMIEMSRKGWRKNEPVELKNIDEKPKLAKRLIAMHIEELDYNKEDLKNIFGWRNYNIEDIFHLEKPKLRLVT